MFAPIQSSTWIYHFRCSLTQWHGWMSCTHIFCCFWLGRWQKMTNTQGEDVAGGFEYARIFLPNRCTDSPYWRSHFGASGGSKPGEFSSNFAGLVSSYVAHFFTYNSGSHTEWYPHAIGDASTISHSLMFNRLLTHMANPNFWWNKLPFLQNFEPPIFVDQIFIFFALENRWLSVVPPRWIRPFSVGCRLAPGRRRIGAWGTGASQVRFFFPHLDVVQFQWTKWIDFTRHDFTIVQL